MKKLLLVAVVVALALTLVPLALAGAPGGGWKHGHAKFNLVGSFVASTPAVAATPADATTEPVLPVAATITVKVKAGSHIKGMRGKEIPFTIADGTKVWQLTEDGRVESSLEMISKTDTAADKVLLKGKITQAEGGPKVYTVTSIRYIDRTPDEALAPTTPPVTQ